MNFDCEECKAVIYWDDDWHEDESGAYHQECHELVTERQMLEAGIPPHGYRVNTNAAYDWNDAYERDSYKNENYMKEVLDV